MRSMVGLSLALVIAIVTQAGARSNLPNNTEVLITIMADDNWVSKQGLNIDSVKDIMTNSIAAHAKFEYGSFESTFDKLKTGNVTGEYDPG